jgi:hypothetical protein
MVGEARHRARKRNPAAKAEEPGIFNRLLMPGSSLDEKYN